MRNSPVIDPFDAVSGSSSGLSEYGKEVDEEDLAMIKELCDEDGEVHKNDFIMHLKQHSEAFKNTDPQSDLHWTTKINLAFKLFDKNNDGKISKKEFGWMINSDRISRRQIDTMFKVIG